MVLSDSLHESISPAATPLELRMSVKNPAKASNMARSTLRGLWLWPMYSMWPWNLAASPIDLIMVSKRSATTLHWVVKAAFPVKLSTVTFAKVLNLGWAVGNCLKTLLTQTNNINKYFKNYNKNLSLLDQAFADDCNGLVTDTFSGAGDVGNLFQS